MLKPDLARVIAEQTGLSLDRANEVITAATDQISAAAARGEDVTLIGFGSFHVRTRQARNGRHPQTGAPLHIGASRTVAFRPGKALREAVQ